MLINNYIIFNFDGITELPTCTKDTGPNGVVIGLSCGSSAMSMCWIRDSLPSNGICQGTWSPLNTLFSETEEKRTMILTVFDSQISFEKSIVQIKLINVKLVLLTQHFKRA